MKRKKIFSGIVVFFLCVSVLLSQFRVRDVVAVNQSAKKAYQKFLGQSEIPWADNSNMKFAASDYKFSYFELGKNKIPILILNTNQTDHASGYSALYMYIAKKVKCMEVTDYIVKIYKKSGIVAMMKEDNGGRCYTTYYQIKQNAIAEIASTFVLTSEEFREWYGEDTYEYQGQEVSKAKFKRLLKKYTKSEGGKKVSYMKNTATNRKKYIK